MNANYLKGIFFALIVAVVSLGGALIGHILAEFLGLGPVNHPYLLSNVNGILPFFIITAVIAFFTGELFIKLNQSKLERFISIFVYHYFFFYEFNMVEKFANGKETLFAYETISHFVPAVIFSFFVTMLWKPKKVGDPFAVMMRNYVKNTNFKGWSLRILIGWFMFVAMLYFTDWLISPFLEPYESAVTLNIPSVIVIKFLAGILFILLVLPIFARWRESKTTLLFWVGFPIFLQVAVFPALVSYWLPMGVRFPYLIQYMVISFLMSILYVQLFYFPKENEVIDDQFKWMY